MGSQVPAVPRGARLSCVTEDPSSPWFYQKLPILKRQADCWRCCPAGTLQGLGGAGLPGMELVLSKVSRDEGLWGGRNVWKAWEDE